MTAWSAKDDETLKRLYFTEGKSAHKVGQAMGRTRNAILGRAHRAFPKLVVWRASLIHNRSGNPNPHNPRLNAMLPKAPPKPRVKPPRAHAEPREPQSFTPRRVEAESRPVGLLGLSVGMCRWPLDTKNEHGEWLMCGAPNDGGVYCARHHSVGVLPDQRKGDVAKIARMFR